jgi:hypothetical protein
VEKTLHFEKQKIHMEQSVSLVVRALVLLQLLLLDCALQPWEQIRAEVSVNLQVCVE